MSNLDGEICNYTNITSSSSLIVQGECFAGDIEFTSLGTSVSRQTFTYVVVAMDLLICLLFVINSVWIFKFTQLAAKEYDRTNVQLTDFAVRVKSLPGNQNWETIPELKIKLTEYIQTVVKNQTQYAIEAFANPDYRDCQDNRVPKWDQYDHSEIVDIDFGLREFDSH